MTISLIPQQLTETTEVGNQSEVVEAEETKTNMQILAALLAEAYVAMPLFP